MNTLRNPVPTFGRNPEIDMKLMNRIRASKFSEREPLQIKVIALFFISGSIMFGIAAAIYHLVK